MITLFEGLGIALAILLPLTTLCLILLLTPKSNINQTSNNIMTTIPPIRIPITQPPTSNTRATDATKSNTSATNTRATGATTTNTRATGATTTNTRTTGATTTNTPVTTTVIPTTTRPPLFKHTFTTAGKSGELGPTLAEVRSAYSGVSWAQNSEFLNMKIQGIQEWTVPNTGSYTIRAVGAGVPYNSNFTENGQNQYQSGMDATIITTLTKGEIISILVGQIPSNNNNKNAGGAGGTFVVRGTQLSPIPIIISGGGGGRSDQKADSQSNATINNSGQNITGGGNGGTNGKGGTIGGNAHGGAGGGLIENGSTSAFWDLVNFPRNSAGGGLSFVNGGIGGKSNYSSGGFGGGGACSSAGAGAGGGYSGGGGSGYDGSWTPGGGGGSYSITGSFITAVANNNDNGFVVITANF